MGRKESGEVNRIIKKIGSFKNSVGVERAVLFGSYGRGNFKKDSDIDLILVSRRFRKKKFQDRYKGLWIKWHVVFKMGYPVDFVCYTPEEFEREKKRVSIVSTALREGIEI